ncbi:response regulator (plasmid) [Alicyclobacillus curvatus]|nr:response regulator [Alicyclobacillus curvatus]
MTVKTLLVDDSMDTLEVLRLHFGFYADIEIVSTARDIQETLEVCSAQPVDLISIDIQLGVQSGFDLCKEIREKLPHTFITMCSLESDSEYQLCAARAGANYFLSKPVSFADISNLMLAYREFHARSKLAGQARSSLATLFDSIAHISDGGT